MKLLPGMLSSVQLTMQQMTRGDREWPQTSCQPEKTLIPVEDQTSTM